MHSFAAGTPILVTGGAGFIGSNLVAALVRDRCRVTVIDNLSSGFRQNLAPFPEVRFVEADIRDAAAVEDALGDARHVFHLAASVGNQRSLDNPREDAEINYLGTLTLLEIARRRQVRRIVLSSSAAIFGEPRIQPVDEDHPLAPVTPYGVSKLAAERLALSWAGLYGAGIVCLRYFNVYGPNQRFDAYGNVIPIFVFKALRGEGLTIHGDGQQTRDFVNVADVARANILAALSVVSGAFNIGSGRQFGIGSLAELVRDRVGPQTLITHGPVRPGDVLHCRAEIRAAQRAFGYEPDVDFVAGLDEYIAWARRELAFNARATNV